MEKLNATAVQLLFSKKLYLIESKLKPVVVVDQNYEADAPERLFFERLIAYLGHGGGFRELISVESEEELEQKFASETLVLCFLPTATQVKEKRPGFVICPPASVMHQNIPFKKELQKLVEPYRYK
jgi:hypothetical protein